jgi:hypothetical protein
LADGKNYYSIYEIYQDNGHWKTFSKRFRHTCRSEQLAVEGYARVVPPSAVPSFES